MEIAMSRIMSNEERANRAIKLVETLADRGVIGREQMLFQVRAFISVKSIDAWRELEQNLLD